MTYKQFRTLISMMFLAASFCAPTFWKGIAALICGVLWVLLARRED